MMKTFRVVSCRTHWRHVYVLDGLLYSVAGMWTAGEDRSEDLTSDKIIVTPRLPIEHERENNRSWPST